MGEEEEDGDDKARKNICLCPVVCECCLNSINFCPINYRHNLTWLMNDSRREWSKKLHPQWTDRLHSFLEFNIIDLLSFTISSSPSAVLGFESRTRENYSRQRSLVCGLDRSVFCAVDNFTKFDIFSRDLEQINPLLWSWISYVPENVIFAAGLVWKSFCSHNFYMIFRNRAYLPSVDSHVVIYCTWDV